MWPPLLLPAVLPTGLQAAERTITSDLEYMISKAVDTSKADYAVFTGVQVGALPACLAAPPVHSHDSRQHPSGRACSCCVWKSKRSPERAR